jgi:ribosomal protein S18 acetylase RimI-like enzyme
MIQIRPALQQDLDTIAGLVPNPQELFLVYPNGHYPFTLEQVSDLFNERFEFNVVCIDDRIVGFANLYQYQPGQYAFIGNVFIVPDCRGQGLGKVMLQYMIKAAFEKYHLPEVRLSVFADNASAMALYQQAGFQQYAQEQRTDPDNIIQTLIHMSLKNPEYNRR